MTNPAVVTSNPKPLISHAELPMTSPDIHSALPYATSSSPMSNLRHGANYDVHEPDHVSVPFAGQSRMQLSISGCANARVRIDRDATELVTVLSDGLPTRVRTTSTEVRLSWPMTFGSWLRTALSGGLRDIEIVLHPAVEWTLMVRGGLSHFEADLTAGKVARIDINGGLSNARFDLPAPTSPVPVHVTGGISELTLRRPVETAVSLAISGGVSMLHLDDQQFGSIGGGAHLVSGFAQGDAPRYALEVRGGASGVCVGAH